MTKKRQNYMRKADVIFARLVRDRVPLCENCGSSERIQCAHIISRSYKAIRTDLDNAVSLCSGCHLKFTHRPLEWRRWVDARFPGRWERLETIALGYPKVDWKVRYDELKEMVG